jgi:hypothetical protein
VAKRRTAAPSRTDAVKVGFSAKEGLAIAVRSGKARWRLQLPLGPVTVGGKRRAAHLSLPERPLAARDVRKLGRQTLDLGGERAQLTLTAKSGAPTRARRLEGSLVLGPLRGRHIESTLELRAEVPGAGALSVRGGGRIGILLVVWGRMTEDEARRIASRTIDMKRFTGETHDVHFWEPRP